MVFFKTKNKIVGVKIDDIILIQTNKDLVEIHMVNKEVIEVRITLYKLSERLRSYYSIVRVHRKFMINIDYIEEIMDHSIKMVNHMESIPISQSRYKSFKTALSVIS